MYRYNLRIPIYNSVFRMYIVIKLKMFFTPFCCAYTGRRLHIIFVLFIFSQVFPRVILCYYQINWVDQSSEYTEPAYPLYTYKSYRSINDSCRVSMLRYVIAFKTRKNDYFFRLVNRYRIACLLRLRLPL